jgi:hypothetical protein
MNLPSRTRILCFILILVKVTFQISAQEGQQNFLASILHEPYDWTLSLSPVYANHPEALPRIVGSFDASLYLSQHVSLNANFAAGKGYVQAGPGLIGIPLFIVFNESGISSESIEGFLLKMAFIILSFENLNFHIPVKRNFEISPYMSLLRFKFIEGGYGKGQETSFNLVAGTRLNIFFTDRFFVSPFVESTWDWSLNGRWGFNGGIQFGFYFYNY